MASFDRSNHASRARLVGAKAFSLFLTLALIITLSVPPLAYAESADTANASSADGQSQPRAQTEAASTGEPLAISLEYDPQSLKCNTPVKFTMKGSGGTGNYMYLQNAMQIQTSSGSYTDDADWTYKKYTTDNTFEYTFVSPGTYRVVVYIMDKGTTPVQTKRDIEFLTVTDDAVLTVDQVADSIAQDCLAQGYKTDYEKALFVHDWIMNNATYDHDLLYDGESGVLIRGKGTCESYHRAFAMVLGRLGIPCERAVGNGHVWSCVKLDGKWTQIDLTWDDGDYASNHPHVYMSHIYFGMTDDMAKAVHSEHKPVAARACTSFDNSYFLKSGEITRWSDPVEAEIRDRIAAGETSFSIEAESNVYPSVYDIIYPLVPYQLSQTDWGLKHKSVEITYVKTDRKAAHYEVEVTPTVEQISDATVSDVGAQTYTGAALEPMPTVKLNGTTLKNGTDYTLSYQNNKNVGTATITITGIGDYTGTLIKTFAIKAQPLQGASISSIDDQTYTGNVLRPEVTVKLGETALVKGTDYVVDYQNNTNVGTATVTITGKGNYSGTATKAFTITAASIDKAEVSIKDQTYAGKSLTPVPTVKLGEASLVNGTDYTVSYQDNVTVGTAMVTITGKGNYAGTKTTTFQIGAKPLDKSMLSGSVSQSYSGSALTPSFVVKDGSTVLKSGTDYTVSYSNNTKVGTANVTIIGKGNYRGTLSTTFAITARSIGTATISPLPDQVYCGKALTPHVVVRLEGVALAEGTDYMVAYQNNTNVGTVNVIVTGQGNYAGTKTTSFAIAPKALTDAMVGAFGEQTYTGSALTPPVTVKDGAVTLQKDKDYTVTYSNNTQVGTATVTIAGKGNYKGSITRSFPIRAKAISSKTVVPTLSYTSKTYTGCALKPAVTVKDGEKALKEGTDYTLAYRDNKNAGMATVTVTGKGNYTGEIKKNFKIKAKGISLAKVTLSYASKTYTGGALKPAVTVKDGKATLKYGRDYTVTYKNNKQSGKATVIIQGKGNYSGSISKTFTIKPAKVTGVKASSAKKEKVTVKWSNKQGKAANVTGYKIVVKFGSKTIKSQYVSGKSAKSKTITLASKYKGKKVKTYVYAYKTIDKKKVCSVASSASTVKIKR